MTTLTLTLILKYGPNPNINPKPNLIQGSSIFTATAASAMSATAPSQWPVGHCVRSSGWGRRQRQRHL